MPARRRPEAPRSPPPGRSSRVPAVLRMARPRPGRPSRAAAPITLDQDIPHEHARRPLRRRPPAHRPPRRGPVRSHRPPRRVAVREGWLPSIGHRPQGTTPRRAPGPGRPRPPFAVAAAVLVAAAGLPAVAPVALVGLKHLAVASVLHALLRLAPRRRLASAGRRLRTAAALGLLWLAAASFGAGQAIAPRPAAAAAVPAPNAVVSPSCATAFVPDADVPSAPTGAPGAARLARPGASRPRPVAGPEAKARRNPAHHPVPASAITPERPRPSPSTLRTLQETRS